MRRDGRWLETDGESSPQTQGLRQALDEARQGPPSDLRQRRLWLRIEPQLRAPQAPRRTLLWASLAAAACGTAGVAMYISQQRHTSVVAQAPVVAPQRRRIERLEEPPALTDVTIQTSNDERITRIVAGNAKADVQPSSRLHLDHEGVPEVQSGKVAFDVPPQASGHRFVVKFAEYRVQVAGTRFVVDTSPNRLAVDVQDGVVEIWQQRRVVRLGPGESWSIARNIDIAPPPRVPVTMMAPKAEPSEEQHLAVAARAARANHKPQEALALYQRLARGSGLAAQNALYEMAAIYREDLSDPSRAVATWRTYRTRFPAGSLRMETDVSLVDTLASLGRRDEALAEAQAFLRRFPASERRSDVARVAGDLTRTAGNCGVAIGYYDTSLISAGAPASKDDAAFHRATCLSLLKSPDARVAWLKYLREYPRGRHVADAKESLQALTRP
ncbi:MAG: FecR domain-containing protein [Deltaproteobacteria bacterium]|nr:FecR domain-containing protein [Deltaproteobacteria bacterium]